MTVTAAPPDDIPGVTRRHRAADLYHERTNFQFIAHSRRWLALSGTLLLVSVLALAIRQLNLGIEFEGGTAWQVEVASGRPASVPDVRDILDPLGFGDAKVSILSGQGGRSVRVQAEVVEDPVRALAQSLADYADVREADVLLAKAEDGKGGTFTLTSKAKAAPKSADVEALLADLGQPDATVKVDAKKISVVLDALPASPIDSVGATLAEYAGAKVADVSVSTVGPTWGETVSRKAVQALLMFFVLLAAYLSFRFEWKMGLAAIVAVIHDIVFTVGFYAVFQFQVTPATVTAFLTILGFSLYDTVVVFDKVAENQASLLAVGRSTYGEMVNRSLNQVLMRSLSTTLVALLPVISLLVVGSLIMGAVALEDFALALLAGLFIGSYSSIFVAAPLLAWWKEREPQYRALADRRRRVAPQASGMATGPAVALEGDEVARPAQSRKAQGVPGPPAVGRVTTPRPRQQRRRKRR